MAASGCLAFGPLGARPIPGPTSRVRGEPIPFRGEGQGRGGNLSIGT